MSNRPARAQTRQRRFATQEQAAEHFQVHHRTIRNWIARGLITGFRMPGARAIRVDLNEIEEMLEEVPTTVARTQKTMFGPKARIVTVVEAINEPTGSDR